MPDIILKVIFRRKKYTKYMRTTSSVYHIEESQKNDTYVSYFFLEIHNHTFIYSGRENFAYGFTDRVPYTSPIKHTYNASSSISSSDFLFYGCFLGVNRNVLCGDGESPPGLGSSSLVFLGLPV